MSIVVVVWFLLYVILMTQTNGQPSETYTPAQDRLWT